MSCVICNWKKEKRYILETEYSISSLANIRYAYGHTLVSPIRHVGSVFDLEDYESSDLYKTVIKASKIIKENTDCEYLQYVQNENRFNIEKGTQHHHLEHVHIQILPRKLDDNLLLDNPDREHISNIDKYYEDFLKNIKR